ncbi:uncharacterized protein, partial [Nicotiana sylvestris]|uniref:uncharacterized protein n=1 Tax=Nicotiana sylvestris TaxID=4096 RepID=UPI00388C4DB1
MPEHGRRNHEIKGLRRSERESSRSGLEASNNPGLLVKIAIQKKGRITSNPTPFSPAHLYLSRVGLFNRSSVGKSSLFGPLSTTGETKLVNCKRKVTIINVSGMSAGGAFGGNRGLRPVPPEKGVFPLDHMHLCDLEKKEYLNCLKSSGHKSDNCRHLSKKYLECRMEKTKAEMMKKIHEQTRLAIEKKNEQTALRKNKGRKQVIFKPGDLVWVHFRKERFPSKRKSKLHPRGDGPFQVLERIGDNAYKLDLPGEFQVSATFNVADLSLFDVGSNSRTNSFQEGGNDSIKNKDIVKDNDRDDRVLEAPRPFTRSQAKELQAKVARLQWQIKKLLIVEE